MADGVGMDLIEVARIERALDRHPRLADRLFTEQEQHYAASRGRPGRHLAARFAAKEAVVKALRLPAGTADLEVTGRVAWSNRQVGMGVQFETVSRDAQAAIASSDHARELSPFDPMLFAMLGARALALMRLGRHDEAADWALKATARPNAHVHILGIAGHCLALAGRHDDAQRHRQDHMAVGLPPRQAQGLRRHPLPAWQALDAGLDLLGNPGRGEEPQRHHHQRCDGRVLSLFR